LKNNAKQKLTPNIHSLSSWTKLTGLQVPLGLTMTLVIRWVMLEQLQSFKPTGNIRKDATDFLLQHGQAVTAGHCSKVANKAKEIAKQFSADKTKAELAGWLHDISAVVPNEARIGMARANSLEVLPEEEKLPMIIHQKLSRLIARDVFHIHDEEILSALECHTTLKANASTLDKIVFVADKIAWDQEGKPPYSEEILKALENSLDAAALVYLDYLWERRETLPVLHPWAIEARAYLTFAG
jgi:predicted HD superfamily hydrolase involved in NAD metabolism